MFKRRILIFAAILLVIVCGLSHAKEPPTSIAQLNSPEYVIGSDAAGPGYDAAIQTFTRAKHLHFNDAHSGIESLKSRKIDALACNEMEIKAALRDSLEGMKLLPGTVGEPAKVGAGISKRSKIPNLKEKFNSFITGIKNDGTFSAMFKRWAEDGNYDMPAVDVPAKSDLTLRVATTGNVMPFSFYIGNDLAGFDIELARRFAAYLGAELEFIVNDFGGALSALAAGKVDCLLSNLYISPERSEAITFSDVISTINIVMLVRDEGGRANDNGLQAFKGKRIGVPVGSSQSEIVREALPDSELLYFEAAANMIQALKSGKIDALAFDEPTAIEFERENRELTRADAKLKPLDAGFIFPKKSGNEKLYSEIDEYIRRIKSDGTFDQIYALWFGDDESKKIIPDYTKFPDTNGVIDFAVNNETPPFNYIKDGRLTGSDIDIITRFCREKGYRPNFSAMNFTAILPAVKSGKCDMSGITMSITPERSESVRFSEPLYTLPTVLLVVKPRDIPATTPAKTSGHERRPKYSTLSELDGKPIGVQTGVPSWVDIVKDLLPESPIAYFSSFPDITLALKAHKIEAFLVDSPVYALMSASDNELAMINEKVDEAFNIAFAFPKSDKGKNLCDEMSEYIRKIKASGELDAIIAKWEGADESAKTLPDYKNFPAPNGVLSMVTEGEYAPFNYYRGDEIAGLEIDIAARFCEAYGYGLKVTAMNFDAIIPAVVSGKYDFAGADLDPADEHEEVVYFSEPYYRCRSVMACLRADDSTVPTVSKYHDRIPKYKSLAELDGKLIGIQPAIYEWAYFVRERLPHSQFAFYNTFTDIITALRSHKIDAFLVDEPVFNLIAAEYDNLAKIDEKLDAEYDLAYGFPKTDRGKKLCDEMSAYIRKIKANGELDAIISKWEGADESAKTLPDYKSFPAPNGVITMATEGEYPPFNYYRDNDFAGYEIDIAARFCQEYGYGLSITAMTCDAIIAAVISGKYDFAADALTPSDEHLQQIYFSEPYSRSRSVMACLKADDSPNTRNTPSPKLTAFDGKTIGMQPGIIDWEEWVAKNLPHSQVQYYNTYPDLVSALKTHKIAGFLVDSPVLELMAAEDDTLTAIDELIGKPFGYSFFYAKTKAGKKLCDEMSEYILKIKASGELDAILSKWQGSDESAKIPPDFKRLPAKNGTLTYAAEGSYPPFSYYKGTQLAGIDIDLAVGFCREYGYGLNVQIMLFDATMPAIYSGKVDFAGDFTPSEEHEEAVYFSEPYCQAHSVMACLKDESSPVQAISKTQSPRLSEFDGKPIGIQIGVPALESLVRKFFPHSQIQYYNTFTDIAMAIKSGKISAFIVDSPVLALMSAEDPRLVALDENIEEGYDIAYGFPKTDAGKKLADEMSEFIRGLKATGELEALINRWTGTDESAKVIPDYKKFPAPKGVLKMATKVKYAPMNYFKGNDFAGIDIDLAVRFCEANGYGLEITAMSAGAIVPAVASGKYHFAGADLNPTPENLEVLNFSEPYYRSSHVVAYLNTESEPQTTKYASLAGKKIGVQIGTTCAELVPENIPSATVEYYNSLADQLTALKAEKVAAICCSLPAAISAENEDARLTRINPPLRESYLYPIFAGNDRGKKLCEEYSAFIKTLWDDGTIDALNAKWLSAGEAGKTVDEYTNLPATNGKMKMVVDATMLPFAYMRDNRIVGYDIDLAVRFCKAKGYALEVENMPLTGAIASVKSGKSDFSQSMNQTPERAENTIFTTTPTIKSGNVLLTLRQENHAETFSNIPDLAGKRIGVMTGTRNPEIAKKYIPSAEIINFSSMTDTLIALKTGKIEAICTSDPVARFIMLEDDDIAYFSGRLTYVNAAPIFPKTEKGEKLRDQYSKFIKPLWNDGTINRLEAKWFSKDASKRVTEDYSNLPATNGKLKMAVDLSLAPFAFMKDGKIVGYDVDLAVKFCRAYGYGLEVVPMQFGEIIPAVVSGKCDFADSSIAITEERAKTVSFSFPNVRTGNVIVMLKSKIAGADSRPLSYFAGKNVGLLVGSDSSKAIEDKIPNVKLTYFDSPSYIIPALMSGRIDAFYFAVPTALNLIQTHSDLAYIPEYVSRTRHTAMFPNTNRGRQLCDEYTDFLNQLWEDGTIDKLAEKWMNSDDESKQVTEDYTNLPAHNGTLKLAVTEGHVPFVFEKDNRMQGYDIDLAVMFCKSKGCGLEIEVMNHNGVLSSMYTGKCDFSYSVQWTEERAKTVLFSPVPNAETGSILVVRKSEQMPEAEYTDMSQLAGKKFGVTTSAVIVQAVTEKISDAELVYFESYSDLPAALIAGKIDAFACSLSTVYKMILENLNITYLPQSLCSNYHSAAFAKTDKGRKLCNEYAEFLKTLSDDGTMANLKDKWIFTDEDNESGIGDDYSDLPATNGTITMAIDPSTMPYAYVKNGKVTGYDVELAIMFCRAKGYGLRFLVMNLGGILGAVQTGKCDFTCGMMYSNERAQSVLFSPVPNMEAVNVVVVRKRDSTNHTESAMNAKLSDFAGKTTASTNQPKKAEPVTPRPRNIPKKATPPAEDEPSFFDDIAASFQKTFIRESRWLLFAEGIMNTMIITVLSIFAGIVLGFSAFMFCRTGSIIANAITKFSVWLIKGTPIVVLLMILYYVIFGSIDIKGIWVAVIAFTLTFGTSVYRMLTFGTGAVDRGQTEAAYALGFTDLQTFFTVILPQAALHFMPSFKEEVTMLIKSTSVVGYIAVQDLTKMGDIVRSRTYEAFFPLIAVAVIYFVLAGMLNIIVTYIHVRITPSKRRPEDILKGIKLSGEEELNHD